MLNSKKNSLKEEEDEEKRNEFDSIINRINNSSRTYLEDASNDEFLQKKEEFDSIINSINPPKETESFYDKDITNKNIVDDIDLSTENTLNNNSLSNKASYIGRRTASGIAGGITGIGQAVLTDIADNLKKGKDKSVVSTISDTISSLVNPIGYGISNIIENQKKSIDIMKDENSSLIQKAVAISTTATSEALDTVLAPVNALVQATGKANPNLDKNVLELNDKISQPVENWKRKLAEEGENYGAITNTLGNVGEAVGNMVPSIGASVLTQNPSAGLAVMGVSAKGQSTQEALSRGSELEEAVRIGDTKGMIEVGTEMLTGGVNIFGRGALDDIAEGIVKGVNNNVAKFFAKQGLDASGEILEETISDILDTIIDKGTVEPEASYSIKDWGKTALETTLTTFVLNVLTGGLVNDIQTIKYEDKSSKSKITIDDIEPFYVLNKNADGTINSIKNTNGIEIENPNRKVDVNPAIIKNIETDAYNVIDKETGILLDSTPYESIIGAKLGFNHNILNLSQNQINSINQEIAETRYNLQSQISNILSQNNEQINTAISNQQNNTIEQNINKSEEINQEENKTAQNENMEEISNDNITTENKSFEDMAFEAMSNVDSEEIESPLQDRNIETIGKQTNVNAYQYDNPEVKPYFQEMAQMIGEDLSYISSSENRSTTKGGGTKLNTTTEAISTLHNKMGYSYDQISKGLQNIINDNGKENNAISKKLELIIDEQLRNGYTNALGKSIAPNQDYINTITAPNQEYGKQNNVETELHKRIQDAISNKNSRGRTYLGNVSDRVINKIKQLLNIEINDRRHVLSDNDIRHMLNEHGNQDIEKKKGQIAITISDIEKIPDIINNYDDIIKGNDNKEGQTIRYIKKYSDNISYVVEVVPEKGNALKIKTMWKKPVRVTNNQKIPSSTSKTKSNLSSSTSITNSIPQNQHNVNTQTPSKSTGLKDTITNIQDFGEKIGGARKDISQPRTVTKQVKEVIHDYTIKNTDNGYSVDFKGKTLKDGFKTQQEAEQYILDFKDNIKSNLAFVEEGTNGKGEKVYTIRIRNPRTLKSTYTDMTFSSKEAAENYAIGLSMYLKEYGKNLHRPEIQKVSRLNVKNKNATNTTGNDILTNFGFKGGEFGNWVKQSERQQFLNYAQDAFTDLATALNIEPSDLGQNGEMNIAFGARGKGLSAAVAHFEPEKHVINMTRLKGAGSLAHEYGHSIDNWLARLAGFDDGMATTNYRMSKLSDNLRNAINEVREALNFNISTNQEEVNKKNTIYEKNRKENLEYHLKYLDKVFAGEATKMKRIKGKYETVPIEVTEQQKNEYNKIKETLMNGQLKGEIEYKANPQTLKTDKIYPQPIDTIQKMYKEVVGRKIEDDTLYWLFRYGKPSKQVAEVKSESAFRKSAIELDKATGRKTPYFSKIEEMWARAFEAYVSDKLKAKEIVDTYLVHSVNNGDYALFNPFPAGEERQNINKAFDNLIQTMKDENILHDRKSVSSDNTKKQDDGIRYMKKGKSKKSNNQQINNNEETRTKKKLQDDNTKSNAERADAYIEQEIKKLEANGKWDNSIPATSLTDIRKTIEDYLGLGIKKGHFRQSAYGIYKSNRDVIRTKEFKDMDSILHETGHALDLGNRLKLDKESIADELFTAIDKLGGYEDESRTVRLEEGFAEVIREYSIIPEQAKKDYPQSVAVIQEIQRNDKSFNDFIGKVQEQTYNYIHQNPQNRVHSNISIGEQTDKTPLTKAWLKQEIMRNVWDKDYVVKEAVKGLADVKGKTVNQLKASDNAYYLTRLASGISDKVTSMLADGYIDENGNKLMPGLNKVSEILGDDPQRYNDLRDYLVAKRDTEYKAKTLKTGIRNMDTQYVLNKFKNDTQIKQAAKVIYKTLDGVLQYAVNNGLITEENAKVLRESNAFYVPMQRVIEGRGNQTGKRGAVSDIIKKRTGSELDVKDVLENIVANSSNIIQQVENNNVLKALYNQGEEAGLTGTIYDVIDTPMIKIGTADLSIWENELKNQGVKTNKLDLEKTIDLFAPNKKVDSKNLITSFINDKGKRIYLQFNDEVLFNSLMNMDTKFMSKVLQINSKLNMPLRYGATMANIGFAIPNMISDTAQASIYSNAGFVPIVDNALGVLDVLTATNKKVKEFVEQYSPEYVQKIETMYSIYKQTGSTSSTRLSQYREATQNVMKDVYGTKNNEVLGVHEKFKPLKRLLDILTYIPELSEQSTRFRVFEKNYDMYKDKGNSEMDSRILAALESRDATQDFGRTGNLTREINQLIPFSAARVGSAYTFAEKVMANPTQTGMRIALLTALAMAIKEIGYEDDEIEELNQRKKDDNFILKIGNNVVTIKKPQGILRSMINLAEYIQDLATGHIDEGKEGERLGEWITNAIMDNMPADSVTGLVPNMVAPLIENAINKDFYYNTDIVKSYDLDLPDSEQYYDYNSQLAILLGKAFNYSPAKIDNLISGYFAGLGTQVTNIMDYVSGKMGLSPEKPEMGAESNTVGKRFIVNVNTNSASIDEVYNRKTELTKKQNGGTITAEEETELETLKGAITNLSKVNKQIKEIKSDLTTSGKEKAEQIKVLQQQKTDIARQALGKDLIHQENASKIETTSFYPSNSSLSLNNYKLELTSDMKEEYAELAQQYYSKYENQGLYSQDKLKEIKTKAKEYAKKSLMQKYRSQLVKTK